MRVKRGISLVVGVMVFSGLARGAIYTEGDVKATLMPSGNTWSTTNSVFVGDQSNGMVRLSTGQQWNLTSDIYRSSLGESSGVTGTVEINGGTWNCGQQLCCGYGGIGRVVIDSNGVWSIAGSSDVIFGSESTASGSLDLKNGTWNSGTLAALIGYSGYGKITVGPSGTWTSESPVVLGCATGGSGDVILNGGLWNVSYSTVYVGYGGSGAATVEAGGSWNAVGREIHLGESIGSTGTVSLADSSTLTCAKMILGNYGYGDMTVSENSSFSAGNLYMGYEASGSACMVVTNQSYASITTNLMLGSYGPGDLIVTDNSLLETKITGIGCFQGNAALYVLNNSSWISHGETFIGDGRGYSCVTVDHAEWVIEDDVTFGGLVGNWIELVEGRLSSPTHATIEMNFLDDIDGSGTISNLTISGGQLNVGPIFDDAPGSLTLQNVSFVSTNKTALKLAVWADGSCDQLVFDDSVDFSGADIVIEFADDIAPSNGMVFALFNYTGTGTSPLRVDNVTAPDGWALDPSGVFAEKICKITSVAVDGATQTAHLNFCVNPSGGDWVLQSTTNLLQPDWQNVYELTKCARSNFLSAVTSGNQLYWRMVKKEDEPPPPQPPAGMVLIPAGTNSGTDPDFGAYLLTVEAFYMDATEITKAQWDDVYNWALSNGYEFDNAGQGKASNHPVHTVNWYDCVKWCNARSQMDGRTPCYTVKGSVYKTGQNAPDCNMDANGYRLPTNDEWEYAARGGLSGKRFPWGDTITHDQANYYSSAIFSGYDISSTRGYHPDYHDGDEPYTSPVSSFAPNAYGLYDIVGNVWEWSTDATDTDWTLRGGCWEDFAFIAQCGIGNLDDLDYSDCYVGFRTVFR